MEHLKTPSKFIVVIRSRIHKSMKLKEAQKYKELLDAEYKENYPWETRHAHIYSLLR